LHNGALQVGYLLALSTTIPFILFPMRDATTGLMASTGLIGTTPHPSLFVPLTVSLLGAVYAVTQLLTSVWFITSIVGSLGFTFVCFLFPGVVIYAGAYGKPGVGSIATRIAAVFVILLGLGMIGHTLADMMV
jgi:hypothetical protein